MEEKNPLKELVQQTAKHGIIISSDVKADSLSKVDVSVVAARLVSRYKGAPSITIVTGKEVSEAISSLETEKAPKTVEVLQSSAFKPEAKEYDAEYRIDNAQVDRVEGTTADFVSYFNDRLRKIRAIIESQRHTNFEILPDIESLKSLAHGREVTIIGIVINKFQTKNGNMMVNLEDSTGEAKVIFMNGTSQQAKELFEGSTHIIEDEVIAVRGKISGPFVIANTVLWPDVPIKDRKKTEQDLAIAFMSDIHVGSKKFMKKNFLDMLKWLNGDTTFQHASLAGKVKYIVMAGDVADGVGTYPGQERDLEILDIYEQYKQLFDYIEMVPDYIHVFVLAGNHDAVQRAEPQPPLTRELMRDFSKTNVHVLTNPSGMRLHGLDVLAYHGTSLDSIIRSVPGMSYAKPELEMIEVLKRRHLSPVYGGNVIVPSKSDNMVIEKVPDILHMGHIHKNGVSSYHGVGIVNSGTWQARTDFQLKQGHIPSPCIMPIYETKSGNFVSVDFTGEA